WLAVGAYLWSKGVVAQGAFLAEAGVCLGCLMAVVVWGRKLSTEAAWAFCGVVTAAALLGAGQHLLPPLAQPRFPVQPPGKVAALLRDGPVALACNGQQWGSLHFLLGGDFFNLNRQPLGDLAAFLRAHRKTVLVTCPADWKQLHQVVPSEMQFEQIGASGV